MFETDEFARALRKLPVDDVEFIQAKLSRHAYPQLRQMPFHGANIRKLRGYDPATWRYRIGRYRVFYHVDEPERIVYLLTLEKRGDSYRRG